MQSASFGCGFAGAVLTPMLLRCDRDGLRAVLDTSTHSNVQLYSRLGFETTAEFQPSFSPATVHRGYG